MKASKSVELGRDSCGEGLGGEEGRRWGGGGRGNVSKEMFNAYLFGFFRFD